MKTVINKAAKFLPLFFLAGILFFPVLVHAQTLPPGPGDDPDVPVDGGLSLLLAAGIGYGIKKIQDERKKSIEEARQILTNK